MIFNEPRFILFFAIVFAVYWATSRNSFRKFWLLSASYLFYAAWDWRFLSLIVLSTLVDYGVGLLMQRRSVGRRGGLLGVSLVCNLGILGLFKYYDFFVTSAAELSTALGLPMQAQRLELILPLGISFYTFQTLSYTIDIYRGKLEPTRSLLDFALFVGFFPQLVAGPIVRAGSFLPQLRSARVYAQVAFRRYLTLFLLGFIKKACVADNVARLVDAVYAQPDHVGIATLWLTDGLYLIQLYCDFSGYSDMAIATAGMLGYGLAENFNFPLLATSRREYLRRWHISLVSWFTDYVYFPLGGNRVGRERAAVNLFVISVIVGLWHGADWTFAMWGVANGTLVALEYYTFLGRMKGFVGLTYTLTLTVIIQVFFRAPDMATVQAMLTGMFGLTPLSTNLFENGPQPQWILLLVAFGFFHWLFDRRRLHERLSWAPDWLFAVGYGAAIAVILPFVSVGYRPFIYFQF